MDVPFALSVIFTGIVIVFIVLIALIGIMMLMGKVMGSAAGGTSAPKAPEAPKAPAPAPMKAPSNAVPKMAVQDGIGEETVAVIAAAVAAFTGGTGKILSVKKASAHGASRGKGSGRSAWSLAGLRENTQPF